MTKVCFSRSISARMASATSESSLGKSISKLTPSAMGLNGPQKDLQVQNLSGGVKNDRAGLCLREHPLGAMRNKYDHLATLDRLLWRKGLKKHRGIGAAEPE